MIRFILILACLFGVVEGIDGMWVGITSNKTPKVVSINDLVANPTQKLPRFLEISDAAATTYTCKYEVIDSTQTCTDMKIPLLSKDQAAAHEDGKEVTASVIFKASSSLVALCNKSAATCLDGVTFRGVSKGSMLNDLDDKDRETLTGSHIKLDDHATFIEMAGEPEGVGSSVAQVIIALLIALALIFLWPKKKPRVEV